MAIIAIVIINCTIVSGVIGSLECDEAISIELEYFSGLIPRIEETEPLVQYLNYILFADINIVLIGQIICHAHLRNCFQVVEIFELLGVFVVVLR